MCRSYLIDERQQRQRQRGCHERCIEYATPRSGLHHNSTMERVVCTCVHVVTRLQQQLRVHYLLPCVYDTARTSSSRRHLPRAQEPLAPAFCIHAHRVAKRLPIAVSPAQTHDVIAVTNVRRMCMCAWS